MTLKDDLKIVLKKIETIKNEKESFIELRTLVQNLRTDTVDDQHLDNAKLLFLEKINIVINAVLKFEKTENSENDKSHYSDAIEDYVWGRDFFKRAIPMVINFDEEDVLEKREWCYSQSPEVYGVACDKCLKENITWSEYKHRIWCFDCEIDTVGTVGIFGAPIMLNTSKLLGISFDRIRLSDNKIIKMVISPSGSPIYPE